MTKDGRSGEAREKDRLVDRDLIAGGLVFLAAVAGVWLLVFRGGAGLDATAPQDDRRVETASIGSDAGAESLALSEGGRDSFPEGPVDLVPETARRSASTDPDGVGGPEIDAGGGGRPEPSPDPDDPSPQSPPPQTPALQTPAPPAPAPPPPAVRAARPAADEPCPSDAMVRAYYCTAKADLAPAAQTAFLDILARRRACIADRLVEVRGYADTRGPKAFNSALAENRAQRIAAVLRDQGVAVGGVKGVGELEGLPDGRNCPAQRRVDVDWSGGEGAPAMTDCALPEDMAAFSCP